MDSAPGSANEGSTVLVVDDSALGRMVVADYLAGHHRVVEAASGEEALQIAADAPPDVVVLDLHLPGIDGIETCRRLKNANPGVFLPILMLTAEDEQARRNAALEAGADDFLRKPVDPQELRFRVRSFLTLRRQGLLIHRQLEDLRHLDELKEDLVALVGHDLRNALGGILALTEVAQAAGGASAEDLDRILRAGERMRSTLDDLVHVKQLEDGVLPLQPQVLPIGQAIAGARALVEPQAHARSVSVKVTGQLFATVRADPHLLERAVFNLLQNAVKHSPTGGTVVAQVSLVETSVRLSVTDQGRGVAGPTDRLFEKYRRAGARQGAGLGLYLVQMVVRAHDGHAGAMPDHEGGACFFVQLPQA